MFSGLTSARLKSAENALRHGRIDEAFRLAASPDLRDHRRARAVLEALVDHFVERAREHFREERFTEAMADLDKAQVAGIKLDDITELRRNVMTVAAEVKRQEVSRRELLDAARQRVEAGSLAAGRLILAGAGESDHEAQRLDRVIERRAAEVQDAVRHIEHLLDQNQVVRAVERLQAARRLDVHHPAVTALESRVCDTLMKNVRAALEEGRLGRAVSELANLRDLAAASSTRRELADMLALARSASEAVAAHQFGDARRHVLALGRVLPGVKWIEKAAEQIRQLDDIHTALRAGPLGEPAVAPATPDRPARPVPQPARPPRSLEETIVVKSGLPAPDALPERLLMLVDGGGSYLILRSGRISIGRAASSQPADVPIFSDLGERAAHISRVDEDYFLFADRDVEIGGRRTRHQLLRHGDRVMLGRRAKFEFHLPSRKSLSAVMDLSDTTRVPSDVRRVILFHGHAAIGAGSTAHVRCRAALRPLVMFERDGALWVRPQLDDRGGDGQAQRVELGRPMEVQGVGFVLEPWRPGGMGSSAV